MQLIKKLFYISLFIIFAFSFLPSFAEEEDNQCKDRCDANGFKKDTGYFTDSGSCKEGFTLIEATCCCEPK